ncbi:MAG: nitrogen metabolism transcriptional regulator, NtrC, Fis Family [Phycisphaerales bacterium]|nr:nitrogen metabolism transcriptional regulator, NtrC, Fis Family [Phycisphaerales bacterium]
MILIVEDDPLSRRALQSLMAAHGYPCRAVPSAEDALTALREPEKPGMVLIDIDLPGMNGLQLLHRLQQAHPRLPCSLMSANDHDLSPPAGDRAVPFFPKPLNLKRLFNFLRDEEKGPITRARVNAVPASGR